MSKDNAFPSIKRRLERERRKPAVFHAIMRYQGTMVSDYSFDQDVVKVGTLRSSHVVLPEKSGARMHAVIEREGDVWRVIDLGSPYRTYLDGNQVDKNAVLDAPKGVLRFGDCELEYSLGPGGLADLVEDVDKARAEMASSATHHKRLMESLMKEMERVAPRSFKEAALFRDSWAVLGDKEKRRFLRLSVDTIRRIREEPKKFDERAAGAALAVGADGIAAIYDLTREEAVAKAREVLCDMTQAKQSLELFHEMDLLSSILNTAQAANMEADQLESLAKFKRGHEALEDSLQTAIAAGPTILLACLSRAGGGELSEEDREKLRAQWAATVSAANSR